eukprot:185996-Pyramimonas_sp.AAC.1
MRAVTVAIFGAIWARLGLAAACMRGGGGLDETRTRGPFWDSAGNAPFRDFVREVHAWLNVASASVTPPRRSRGLG